MEKQILEQALAQIDSNGWAGDGSRALVLGGEGWHAGVIGIVASRIVDRLCRPTVMVALSNGHGQGSARSVPGFHLATALQACDQHLITHGGHEMAAGLKIETARFENFRQAFCEYARTTVSEEMLTPQLKLECAADLGQISQAMVTDLRRLGPFGRDNPKPLLCLKDLTVAGEPRRVGKSGEHLQIMVRQKNQTMKCIAFSAGDLLDRLTAGATIEVAAEPGINGRTSVELQIKDIHFAKAE
jgi:single-stranded-DNA-specific exonuclease